MIKGKTKPDIGEILGSSPHGQQTPGNRTARRSLPNLYGRRELNRTAAAILAPASQAARPGKGFRVYRVPYGRSPLL